jgi:CPA1 family monovalent cation:H+ antiporter
MPWAAAIALGAIVAPPDAAAATAVLRQLRPPHRLLVILEGESLVNDASALLIYRLAVGATVAGAISGWSVMPTLLLVTLGSIVLGLVLSRIALAVNARIRDIATAVIVQFCNTFGVWIVAERLHLSGIITMVVFAMAVAKRAPGILPARIRVPAWAVWEVAVFVLNVLAFILVGFQLKSIAGRASGSTGMRYLIVASVVCGSVILARIVWVSGVAAISRWYCSLRRNRASLSRVGVELTVRGAAVVSWAGMRGTVTLAAALALPTAFPSRDLILATAFGVTLGTLVLQGMTLRPLLLFFRLKDDGSVEREVRQARVEAVKAALAAVAGHSETETIRFLKQSFELQLLRAEKELAEGMANSEGPAMSAGPQNVDGAAVRAATQAQRRELMALRDNKTIGDAAFQQLEEEFDWMELGWAELLRQGDRVHEER